jgi:hypothetical protein
VIKHRWAGYIAYMGEMRTAYRILVRIYEGRGHLGTRTIDERIILECILKK